MHSCEAGDPAGLAIRDGTPDDIGALQALILEHGPNRWNHLPVDEVRTHVAGIADDRTGAVVTEAGSAIVAVVTYEATDAFERYQPSARAGVAQGHVCEAVVHRDHVGRGIGARLLRAAVARLQALGCVDIYIERHEQNAASAGMMRKAGFIVVDSFADPARRAHGSGRTTVCRMQCAC
ncbi:GNAT family N-acetyltransferase [Marilutibacter alkalisoli]|uniref:GNAT family N-acetyltransferase n=1 Tax=Marilutibacter alkalisoli TaxID=2591633 RepID=A0A514BUV4_9GAMM|nr:GNAT family N-acetyltransferase [Lysobacter alkalisoli]QDH71184.1 GNAT family N-acetyltransferase [Lysobacter alkalisoli]